MVRFEQMVCKELAQGACEGYDVDSLRGQSRFCSCPCPAVRGIVSLYDEHDVLAMELMGPNLREYAMALGPGRWPLPEDLVLVLGAALVGRLQQLHAAGFVHRDIKPDNVVLSLEEGPDEGPIPRVVFVDFALAIRFASPDGTGHIVGKIAGLLR
ncbi:unnamed protein product [Prorocentrum cordatum]|uniref:Casein kinase I n=1 Tax=Prorocentrum cordatum TaxID=2364126 RepID=A0ABN9R7R2_9DINO|nr:unnamed protein product [Polarella glacialis]